MGLFDDIGSIEDLALKYGPGAALGGGLGFLAGGPGGAAVGAVSSVASQVAAEKAKKALPDGTPDWLKTGVEYGIYGVGGGIGFGGAGTAGKEGLQLALQHLALGESAKLGVKTAIGAVGGQAAARVLGAPDGVGELVGSLAGPLAGPAVFNGLRGAAYRSDNTVAKTFAEAMGANEANSTKIQRMLGPTTVRLTDRADTINGLQNMVDYSKARIENYSPTLSEQGISDITGGFSYDHLLARAKNQMPPDLQTFDNKAFRSGARRLQGLQTNLADAHEGAQAAADALEAVKARMPTPEGEVVSIGGNADKGEPGAYIWRASDGTQTAIPDALAQAYQKVNNAVEATSLVKEKAESTLKRHLGTDIIPETLEEQTAALRDKITPGWREAVGPDGLLDPAVASSKLQELAQAQVDHNLKYKNMLATESKKQQYAQDYLDYLNEHPDAPLPPKGMWTRAVQAYQGWKQTRDALAENPKGYLQPTGAEETLTNYQNFAAHVASALPTNQQKAKFSELMDNSRISLYKKNPDGLGYERRYLVSDPAGGPAIYNVPNPDPGTSGYMADVRSLFQSADDADQEPIENLVIRHTPDQLAARSQDWGRAVNAIGPNEGVLAPVPQTGERFYGTQKQLELAQRQWERTGQAKGLPMPDGPVLETNMSDMWKEYNSYLLPQTITIEDKMLTPEYAADLARGFSRFANMAIPKGATPEAIKDHVTFIQELLRPMQDRVQEYMSVTDQALSEAEGGLLYKDAFGNITGADPMRSILLMLGRNRDPAADMYFNDTIHPWGSFQQMVEKVQGKVVTHPIAEGFLHQYLGSIEANANTVAGTHGIVRNAAERAASDMLGNPRGLIANVKNATGLAAGKLTFNPRSVAESVGAFTDALHPLSQQNALRDLMTRSFRPELLDTARIGDIAKFEKDNPDYEGQIGNWLNSQWRTFVDHPQAYPEMAENPTMMRLRTQTQMLDQELEKAGAVWGVTPQTTARKNTMLIADKNLRSAVNLERIGSGNSALEKVVPPAKLVDLVDEVVQGSRSARINSLIPANRQAKPLTELLVHGAAADNALPLATYQSMATQQLVNNLKDMALPGQTITPDDLLFRGGSWKLRSTNKFGVVDAEGNVDAKQTAELQKSLAGINDIMNGEHEWGGIVHMSQTIAMGTLAADMSLYGRVGFKYAAHSLLAGDPIGAAKVLSKGVTSIMSDYGFYSWLRNNMDEITYLSQLGLTGGVKNAIAGAELNGKLPMESLPIVGRAFTGMHQGTDLQFNRAMFYWKVEGVRQQLEVAKNFRAMDRDVAQKLIYSTPNLSQTVDEMGGLDAYLYGEHQDVVQAAVRQVNRSLGGIDLKAEGVGMTRQALEQTLLFVPGFLRGQIGQWASVITKPNTLEGHLAIGMLASEYMFGASVALGLSRLMGTEHRINWNDMSKSTWLGLPLPEQLGGGTAEILPTMALPRLAAKITKDTVAKASQGQVPNTAFYLDQFAQGRLSPMLSAATHEIQNKDFFGRSYKSNLDRYGSTLADTVLPIAGSSAVDDIKEAIRKSNNGVSVSPEEILTKTGLQIMGKSMIPTGATERLNNMARQAKGQDWNLLTDAEKQDMRSNPAVVMAESEENFNFARTATSAQSHVDLAYKDYAENVRKVFEEPVAINGTSTTQAQDDALLQSGEMDGTTWRSRYHTRQLFQSNDFMNTQQRLAAEGYDPAKLKADKIKRFEENRNPSDLAWLVQRAKDEFTSVKLGSTDRTVSTPQGEMNIGFSDFAKFEADRQAVLARYPSEVRDRVLHGEKPGEDPGIVTYRAASEAQKAIEEIPRYRGLNVAQGDTIDQMLGVISKVGAQIRSSTGLPTGTSLPGLAAATQASAMAEMQRSGLIKTSEDLQLAAMAITMSKSQTLSEALKNPQQVQAILANPAAVLYYPYLRYRVPRQLWTRLPQQIFKAPLAMSELQNGYNPGG